MTLSLSTSKTGTLFPSFTLHLGAGITWSLNITFLDYMKAATLFSFAFKLNVRKRRE